MNIKVTSLKEGDLFLAVPKNKFFPVFGGIFKTILELPRLTIPFHNELFFSKEIVYFGLDYSLSTTNIIECSTRLPRTTQYYIISRLDKYPKISEPFYQLQFIAKFKVQFKSYEGLLTSTCKEVREWAKHKLMPCS